MNLVIFDVDDTLCFSNHVDDECYVKACEDVLSISIANMNWNLYNNATDVGIIEQLYTKHFKKEPPAEIIDSILDRYLKLLAYEMDKDSSAFQEIPGAAEMVKLLRQRNDTAVGIATGGFRETAVYKLNKLNFDTRDLPIASSDKLRAKKEILLDLINRVSSGNGVQDFAHVTYVGDREYDFRTAMSLGINFIGVDYESTGVLNKSGAENIVEDYTDISKFLGYMDAH